MELFGIRFNEATPPNEDLKTIEQLKTLETAQEIILSDKNPDKNRLAMINEHKEGLESKLREHGHELPQKTALPEQPSISSVMRARKNAIGGYNPDYTRKIEDAART